VIFWVLLYQWGDAIGLRGDAETKRLGIPGTLVVKAEDSQLSGCGFASTVYWMVVSDASYYN
jgi:hypothetical protein